MFIQRRFLEKRNNKEEKHPLIQKSFVGSGLGSSSVSAFSPTRAIQP